MSSELRFNAAVPRLSATPVAGAGVTPQTGAGTPRSVEHEGKSVGAVRDLLRAGRDAQIARVSAEVAGE